MKFSEAKKLYQDEEVLVIEKAGVIRRTDQNVWLKFLLKIKMLLFVVRTVDYIIIPH